MFRPILLHSALAIMLAASPLPACAKEIVVHMKNKGADGMMAFEPSFVKAAPGDTIRFAPTDPAHNAETLPAIWPAGVPPMKGAINKDVVLAVKKPGLYGVKCMPHYAMGMVALVQVGKVAPADISAAKAAKLPPIATRRMSAALAKVN